MITIVQRDNMYIRISQPELSVKEQFKRIKEKFSEISGYHISQLTGASRSRDLVEWRHLMIYTCYKTIHAPLKVIAKMLGGYHHSTIIHAKDSIHDLLEAKDKAIINKYNQIKHLIK